MSAQEFEEWMLPDFVEDAECDLCEEPAMVFDDNVEYGYCPMHAMQMATGIGIEDFEIEPEITAREEHNKIFRGQVDDNGNCSAYTCSDHGTPRAKNLYSYPDFTKLVTNLCTAHAITTYLPCMLYPCHVEEWVADVVVPNDY